MQLRKHASEHIHPGFETHGRRHQNAKVDVHPLPKMKLLLVLQNCSKKSNIGMNPFFMYLLS